jgi:vancomycin permeability regulator SanA
MQIKTSKYIYIISLLMLLHLVLYYLIKYSNQGLSLAEFRIDYIGNLTPLLIHSIILFGITLVAKRKFKNLSRKTINILILLIFVSLVIAYFSTVVLLPIKSLYIFRQPANKIITAAMFIIYEIVVLIFFSVVWVNVFKKSNFVFVRSIINSIVIFFAFLIFAFVFIEMNISSGDEHIMRKSRGNIAVVLGAAVWSLNKPSPSLASRVDKAIELYKNDIVKKIILTGSNAPGELSEAVVAYNYAKEKGIDPNVFEVEQNTTSTTEQISYIKKNISSRDNLTDIILVSDAYHLPRIIEIAKFYNLDIKVSASRLKIEYDDLLFNKLRESVALVIFWFFAL